MFGPVAARIALAGVIALAMSCSSSAPRPAPAAAPQLAQAQIGKWGLDLSARDPSVKPGDDFYRYANGHWLDANHIPPDRARWGSFDELEERSQQQVRALIEALPADAPAGSVAQKVGDYYRAYLDTAATEAAGLAPA
jgi:putative endopeptidase